MPARAFASLRTDAHERSPSGTAVLWGILVLSIAYGIIILSRVWVVGPDGISRGTGTVPYWDFSNLWGGAKLAAKGQLHTLFDTTAYRQELANLFGAPVITGEWSYPPTMLLVGAPLAILPVGMAYLLWISGTILLFALAVRQLHLPCPNAAIAVFSPALAWNVALGQNGALTGALLLAGLLQAERRPYLGGALLGCLIIKPHLAVLTPVVLIARGNWRGLGAAAFTAALLLLLSIAVYGWEPWYGFVTHTGPLMRRIMEAPFPQGYQVRSITIFVLARALGFGLLSSYLVQAVGAVMAVVMVWRSARWPLAAATRSALVIMLTFLATPYSYTYDMVPLAAPLALLLHQRKQTDGRIDLLALTLWLLPCMPFFEVGSIQLLLAPILLLLLVARTLITARKTRTSDDRSRYQVLGTRRGVALPATSIESTESVH